jgi:hypothetical protein
MPIIRCRRASDTETPREIVTTGFDNIVKAGQTNIVTTCAPPAHPESGVITGLIAPDSRADEPTETTVNRSKTSCNRMAYFGLPTRPRWPCVGVLVRCGFRYGVDHQDISGPANVPTLPWSPSTVRCGPRRTCGRAAGPIQPLSLLLAVQAALVLVLTRTYLWLWSGSAVVLLSP